MKTRNVIPRAVAILIALLICPSQVFRGIAFAQGVQASTYTISGTVRDANNTLLQGVSVSDGAGHTVSTNASGVYILSDTDGSYTLTADKNGDPCTKTISWTNPVTVPPGATGKDFTCPVYTISGTVRDANNTPLQGVSVTDGAGHTVSTNANGVYILSDTAGSYTLTADKNGDPCAKTITWTNPVTVPPNATGKDFTCPVYTISGTVRDANNTPLQGVSVTDGAGHTVSTNANGVYTLSDTAGSYTLTADKSGDPCTKTITWTNPVTVPPNATGKDFIYPIYTIFVPLVTR